MKTKAISILILLVAMSANTFHLSAQNSSKFFFDRKYENDRIISSIKYELDYDGLHKKTHKVEYSYNEDGQLCQKETFRRNSSKECWVPKDKTEYTYSFLNDSYTAEIFVWNSKSETYKSSSEKAVYQTNINGNVVSLSFIKTNQKGNEVVTLNWGTKIAYLAM